MYYKYVLITVIMRFTYLINYLYKHLYFGFTISKFDVKKS